jgi:multidrug efflux pump subunit AcrB
MSNSVRSTAEKYIDGEKYNELYADLRVEKELVRAFFNKKVAPLRGLSKSDPNFQTYKVNKQNYNALYQLAEKVERALTEVKPPSLVPSKYHQSSHVYQFTYVS